jgi:phosphatidylglycerol phospholipase C
LDRTTDGTGLIYQKPYYGDIENLRTKKVPHQKIPTFEETLALLNRPENSHCLLNVDVKTDNNPDILFAKMNLIISKFPSWETNLAPRLLLGLWEPEFIEPASRILPYLRRAHIGESISKARKQFWEGCEGFSLRYNCLVTKDGERFRKECLEAGKNVYVWTVNDRKKMIEATKWGVKAILTDKTAEYLTLRKQMESELNLPRN